MIGSRPDRVQAKLLLVDDDETNRDLLSRRLSRHGYEVLTAESGLEALATIASQRVDAVLLDVMMPGMSGIETLRRLRQTRSVSELPVIMVTANDRSSDIVEALGFGANDYVTKPIDFAVTLARIQSQVSARRADPLTGLPNRLLFMEQVDARLGSHGRQHSMPFAVLFLDVDRFKLVNDSLGHSAGDELLVEIAHRLETQLRATDIMARCSGAPQTVARLGGDEFTVLLDGVASLEDARMVAERLLEVVANPFTLQGREVFTSVSVGLVMSDERYQRAEDMIRDADSAMYHAKALGKARCEVFDASMLQAVERRLQLESDLRHAIERGQLQIAYQPIVELKNGDLCGFEALVRWHHPVYGLLSPAKFIPIAEETGLIVSVGYWVLREACRQMRAWDVEFPECADLTVSVNLSPRQCVQPDLIDAVAKILRDTGLSPERLKLEITEAVVLDNSDEVVETLHNLRAMGVHLGLDDFGVGYSALSYLQRFPVETLKIDRTFVTGLRVGGNTEIVRAIVSLATGLAMTVTAEGVETEQQLADLRHLACEHGQGFYFYRPLAPNDVHGVLRVRRRQVHEVPASAATT